MNALIIVLAVIIVILAYGIYYVMTTPVTVANNVYLKDAPTPIDSKKISQPYSVNYTVGVWIYVDTFTNDIGDFIMYGSQSGSAENKKIFALGFDRSAPTLSAKIAGTRVSPAASASSSASSTSENVNAVTITANFPIQTWTYVVVSVSGYYADIYVNGKLVVSKKLQYAPSVASSDTTNSPTFYFSSGKPDIHITGLSRWSKALDPQTVWSYYTKGNGNPNGDGTKYGAAFVLTKDTNNYSWTLF